jgi:hypothetical protein
MSGSLFGCENAVNAYSRELSGGCATYLPVGRIDRDKLPLIS